MSYSHLEFPYPHQGDARARAILDKVLTHPSQARDGDIVALGYPVRVVSATSGAEFDFDFPVPDVMAVKNGRMTLGSDEDISGKFQSEVISWMRICKDNPDNVQGGLNLAKLMSVEGGAGQHPCHIMLWYFTDFISGTLWIPTQDYYGLGRSAEHASKEPMQDFLKTVNDYKQFCGMSAEVIFSHRKQ